MSERRELDVVAALLVRNGRFLICQRPADKERALEWEFPGGKIEPGESPQEALVRECAEELAVEIAVGGLYAETTHSYPEFSIRLRLYDCEVVGGEPQQLEHNALAWIGASEMEQFDFCPADLVFVEKLATDRRFG